MIVQSRFTDLIESPPDADTIKTIRQAVGTQKHCAALAGVDIRSWQRYETGEKSPPPTTWAIFLLAVGNHPRYLASEKANPP